MTQLHISRRSTSLRRCSVVLGVALLIVAGCGGDEEPSASFESPGDGDRVAGGVALVMASDGVEIEPAGEVRDGAGHFHVIADHGCVTPGEAIAKDADRVHFGSGASSGTVYLGPGDHTLCLQIGDGEHAALSITDTIDVEVGITDQEEYCAVVAETDGLVSALGGDHDFAASQAAALNASRLMEQLAAASDQVDADARDQVGRLVTFMGELLDAYVKAETEEAAQEAAWGPEGIMAQYTEPELDAIEGVADGWFQERCGLSVLD